MVNEEITNLFSQTLDYVQIICTTEIQFTNVRNKILRIGNDSIRKLKNVIDEEDIAYTAHTATKK